MFGGWGIKISSEVMFYSASVNAFFAKNINQDLPLDAVEISSEVWEEMLNGQAKGKLITPMEDGYPQLSDPLPPSGEVLVEIAETEKVSRLNEAKSIISLWQTELQLGIISDDDKASLIAWMKYIQALNAVDTTTAPDIEWPVKPE
ncbi:MAG: tail fiber assembly protein [Enterobacterales bacterium endosymbiont of Blomia tropicalis]|uniref:tail fiber assembly protein n=1 Tax=Enterobacterales TaxID=91347 RepID=UPI0021192C8E|nr:MULTISPECIES: tail fiber assembly protein [Enterobacterales]MDL4913150.1 tail fiber assembly protein [Mixta mediterraneensis]